MTDTDLQYIDTLRKSCQQDGTWAERITSSCVMDGLPEMREKVTITILPFSSQV